jgi:class 3 adenylate cyclase
MDCTIIGAEVNLAARVQAAADPDGMLISYPIWPLVHDIVRAEERGSTSPPRAPRVRVFTIDGIPRRSPSGTLAPHNRSPCFAPERP